MHVTRKLRLAASIIVCYLLQTQGADNYTDENRPYEFGFKIDGEQHRHEKKDKDGIIMGEFGFITADDVYHVTVYATDKEGRFKILSMKNIHLKSSPALNSASSPTGRQGHSLALPPAQPTSVSQPVKPVGSVSLEPPVNSCSSCSLPTTTTRAPPPALFSGTSSTGQQNRVQGGLGGSSYGSQGGSLNYPGSQQSYPQQGPSALSSSGTQPYAQQPQNYLGSPNNGQSPSSPENNAQPGVTSQQPQNYPGGPPPTGTKPYSQQPQNYLGSSNNDHVPSTPNNFAQTAVSLPYGQNREVADHQTGSGSPKAYSGHSNSLNGGESGAYSGPGQKAGSLGKGNPQQIVPNVQSTNQIYDSQDGAGDRTPKQYNGPKQQFGSTGSLNGPQGPGGAPEQRGTAKPTLFSAQMQIVDKNTDVHALNPGEKAGLPPGLSKDDMTELLYTFNYTVGFHGHFEEGYTNGVKKGYYYVTARNGVRTRIDYTADDTGFHPKVSQDILDLLSDDVPKPETEKDTKFGLKGYEFKWLYYPVDSKRR